MGVLQIRKIYRLEKMASEQHEPKNDNIGFEEGSNRINRDSRDATATYEGLDQHLTSRQ